MVVKIDQKIPGLLYRVVSFVPVVIWHYWSLNSIKT